MERNKSNITTDFTRRIRALRALKGLTQEDMASKLGMHATTFVAKESGKREFTLSEIIKLCSILDATFENIFLCTNYENIIVKPIPGSKHGYEVDIQEVDIDGQEGN